MDVLSRGDWMDALNRGSWMDTLNGVVGWMRLIGWLDGCAK